MALQLTLTGDAGLEMTYWRITDAQVTFAGAGSETPVDFRFNIQGFKDANYRAKGSSASTFLFYPVGSAVPSGVTVDADILQNASGDLRPALYNWLKAQTGHQSSQPPMSVYGAQNENVDWSAAIDC